MYSISDPIISNIICIGSDPIHIVHVILGDLSDLVDKNSASIKIEHRRALHCFILCRHGARPSTDSFSSRTHPFSGVNCYPLYLGVCCTPLSSGAYIRGSSSRQMLTDPRAVPPIRPKKLPSRAVHLDNECGRIGQPRGYLARPTNSSSGVNAGGHQFLGAYVVRSACPRLSGASILPSFSDHPWAYLDVLGRVRVLP